MNDDNVDGRDIETERPPHVHPFLCVVLAKALLDVEKDGLREVHLACRFASELIASDAYDRMCGGSGF